jgi:hypothetical protein
LRGLFLSNNHGIIEKKIKLRQCLSRDLWHTEKPWGAIAQVGTPINIPAPKIRESGLRAMVICVLVGRHQKQ